VKTLRITAGASALIVAVSSCHPAPAAAPARRQILITNAQVIDGTGSPARAAAVRVLGDRIVAVGALTPERHDSVVDAHGLVLAPGFIDDHSHHDGGLFAHPEAVAAVSQGITTVVVGQDGGSHLPLAAYFDSLTGTPAAINVASYSGHGTIRRRVMGDDYKRPARPDEMARMQDLLRQDMAAGALGLSSGLEYDPGIYSNTDELIALAKVAAAAHGRYISHMRSEEEGVWDAIHELLTIGKEAHLPVQVSHMKLAMKELWGQSDRLIAMLDSARAAGTQVTADVYPYTAWQSDLTVNFPKRDFEDTSAARYMLREIVPPDGLILSSFAPHPEYVGQTLAQIAGERDADPAVTLLALIREAKQYADAHHLRLDDGEVQGVIGASMSEQDVDRIIQWPYAAFCTDGSLTGRHPRGIGSFPRVMGRLVREEHVLTLPDAVRKATSLAASNEGITKRGTIAPGNYADLVLFDPATIIDRATYTEPHLVSTGIETVWVNGQVVWTHGQPTGNRPGQVVRRGT
jgi:N-acyl-D-amino-acid deacylase